MNLNQLEENIISKKTFLCLGLDTDIDKIPKHLCHKMILFFSSINY